MENDSGIAAENDVELKKLIRKIDLRLLPWLSFCYFLSYLDRSNISNVHDQLIEDLELTEDQFSKAVSVFYIGYILLEIPSNLILKQVRPSIWIGSMIVGWGICSTSMVFVTDYTGLMLVRAFLGISEAGFFPGVVFFLTWWYLREEQGLRTALFFSSSSLASAIGGLLAYGILSSFEGVWGFAAWQWLFLIEGIPSILAGIFTWFYLPDFPKTAKFLTPMEQHLASNRVHEMKKGVVSHFDRKQLFRTLLDPKVWAMCFIFLCLATAGYGTVFYGPSILIEAGFDELQSNLLVSPVHFFSFFMLIAFAYHSDKKQERPLHLMLGGFIGMLGFVGMALGDWYRNEWVSYVSLFFANAGVASSIPLILAWGTNMLHGSTRVGVGAAMIVCVGNSGGILGPNIYGFLAVERDDGTKSYALSHFVISGMLCFMIVLTFFTRLLAKEDEPVEESVPGEIEPLINESSEKLY